MDNKNNNEYYTIDLLQIFKALWQKVWLIIICGILVAAMGFSLSAFLITPTYSSSILLYVNNNSISLGNVNFSLSSSDISASRSLVDTYTELLKNRTTLERVIDKTDVSYTYKELNDMIVAAPSNETEIMKITVTSTDPYEAAKIANGIAVILPDRVSEIIDGATMEVVDSAIPVLDKVNPSITKFTAVGFLLGVFIAAAMIVIGAMLDDTIHDEEYVLQHFEWPILAKVPNLLDSESKRYGYKKYGYYYKSYKSNRKSDSSTKEEN
jgi:capsular polysaccharide biosynthesis protein